MVTNVAAVSFGRLSNQKQQQDGQSMMLNDLNFYDIDFGDSPDREYDGKESDMTEYVGEWHGYGVYRRYANGEEDTLMVKGKSLALPL
ncbi:hypothetical protein [Faecalibaculum rodentium]|nr:hypothetical protein [Faecalibaculum rodentium]